MKLQELYGELQEKDAYRTFMMRHPDSFLAAGFFMLDIAGRSETLQFDFFLPQEKRLVAFEFPFKEYKVFDDEVVSSQVLDVSSLVLDLDDLKVFCDEVIHQHNAAMSITKIIAILRDGLWNLTCMDTMLGIIRIKVDVKTREVLSFSKGSIMDIARVVKK